MKTRCSRTVSGLVLSAFITMLAATPASAQDVRLRVAPDLLIPLGDTDVFGFGGGGSLTMDFGLFDFLAPYLSADARYVAPPTAAQDADLGTTLILASGGAGLGFYTYPLPRLRLGASGGSGIYIGSYTNAASESSMSGNVFWRAGADLGYRVIPSLTVSAQAFRYPS